MRTDPDIPPRLSPCHGVEMIGEGEVKMCPRCGSWHKDEDTVSQLLNMFGMSSDRK